MISFAELHDRFEKFGYYATTELLYDAYNALCLFNNNAINPGQDIYAVCLEGPPGAGKTEFAKVYTKLANSIYSNVEMVDYQCDATTGKTELFEDINISAAIRGDADNVNIPGKLIEAIKKVNNGKKVVLFIDEYDKAREETDAFLLQFLQSGKINSTQHGDLEIKEEYKNNLQVIICKNDMREELSGPLSRRIRITRLDYMEPSLFYKLAHRLLIEEKASPVADGLLNLVSLMYEKAYTDREMYNRLPSCSEMLIAIEDADRMMKYANAPQAIIYNIIIRNMFKSTDDITTFESSLEHVRNQDESSLSALVKSMKVTTETEEELDLNSLIAEKVFTNEGKKLTKKVQEMEDLISSYKTKFEQLEIEKEQAIADEINRIQLENGKLVSTTEVPRTTNIFSDESSNIKRGYNIFNITNGDWIQVANIKKMNLSYDFFINKLIEYASKLDVKVYENGILLKSVENQNLIVICELDEFNQVMFKVYFTNQIVPSIFMEDIKNFINFIDECYDLQPKTATAIADEAIMDRKFIINIDALIYNDEVINYPQVESNVYHYECSSFEKFIKDIDTLSCKDLNKSFEIIQKLKSSKKKVLKNE